MQVHGGEDFERETRKICWYIEERKGKERATGGAQEKQGARILVLWQGINVICLKFLVQEIYFVLHPTRNAHYWYVIMQ